MRFFYSCVCFLFLSFFVGCSTVVGVTSATESLNEVGAVGVSSLVVTDTAAIAKAETFKAPLNLSRVYIKFDARSKRRPMTVKSSGTVLGEVRGQQFIYFDVLPGTYSFELGIDPVFNRFTEFDLSIAENSVVLVHCEDGKPAFNGRIFTTDPVLREFDKSCPSGPNNNKEGIGSCLLAYTNKINFFDYEDLNYPHGTCQLVKSSSEFSDYSLVNSAVPTYFSTENSSYQLALSVNSSQGYRDFLNSWPKTSKRSEISNLISNLELIEAKDALEKKVNAALQRDKALPIQAQRDKYMIALTGHLKNQNFKSSLLYFELLDRLKVELSPSITHFWGEALLRTGRPEKALEKLYEYIKIAGPKGAYYRDALSLINEAENL